MLNDGLIEWLCGEQEKFCSGYSRAKTECIARAKYPPLLGFKLLVEARFEIGNQLSLVDVDIDVMLRRKRLFKTQTGWAVDIKEYRLSRYAPNWACDCLTITA
jgi:hypothetical protein